MYKASVQSILYVVIKSGEEEIYGIPDLFAGRRFIDFPSVEDSALSELVNNGCADMDFNGKTKIVPEFESMINSCARSREVAVIDIRTEDGKQHHISLYFVKEGMISIKNIDHEFGGMCSIDYIDKKQIILWMNEILGNSQNHNKDGCIRKVVLETGVIERCKKDELIKKGCTPEQAITIIDSMKGKGIILISRKIRNNTESQACSFVLGNFGDMEMKIEYENNEEEIIFLPIDRKGIYARLNEVLDS